MRVFLRLAPLYGILGGHESSRLLYSAAPGLECLTRRDRVELMRRRKALELTRNQTGMRFTLSLSLSSRSRDLRSAATSLQSTVPSNSLPFPVALARSDFARVARHSLTPA